MRQVAARSNLHVAGSDYLGWRGAAPSFDGARARFQVLDAPQMRQLHDFKRNHPEEHFVYGILLAHAGVLDEAARAFRSVPPSDWTHDFAASLDKQLQALIRRQRGR